MKVGNPDWKELGIEPTDIMLRNRIGVSFAPENAARIGEALDEMFINWSEWQEKIEQVRRGFIFNIGHGAEASGEYLLKTVLEKQNARDESVER